MQLSITISAKHRIIFCSCAHVHAQGLKTALRGSTKYDSFYRFCQAAVHTDNNRLLYNMLLFVLRASDAYTERSMHQFCIA